MSTFNERKCELLAIESLHARVGDKEILRGASR